MITSAAKGTAKHTAKQTARVPAVVGKGAGRAGMLSYRTGKAVGSLSGIAWGARMGRRVSRSDARGNLFAGLAGAAGGLALGLLLGRRSGAGAESGAYGASGSASPTAPGSSALAAQPSGPDDKTLKNRVESEIFRPEDAPKGDVAVSVEHGAVYLRGEIDDEQTAERLVEATKEVEGVSRVVNLLHASGEPAPTKRGGSVPAKSDEDKPEG